MAKVMISIPDRFLEKIDRAARSRHRSRSGLIREALQSHLEGSGSSRHRSWKRALAPLKRLEEQWVGAWNSTDIIRYYRDRRFGREDSR